MATTKPKKVRYLCNEKHPEGALSASQLTTFMACRKRWEYSYVEGIKPKIEKTYLTIGKLCHTGMQHAFLCKYKEDREPHAMADPDTFIVSLGAGIDAMRKAHTEYVSSIVDLTEWEGMDTLMSQLLTDAENVFAHAYESIHPERFDVYELWDGRQYVPALELHFKVPCPGTKGLHGYIDAILKDRETGDLWCLDYKFRKTLQPVEEEAFDIKNAVYVHACLLMGIPITGTRTWQHSNVPPKKPTQNKNGTMSRAAIRTTWDVYRVACMDAGLDPMDYIDEMYPKFESIEWVRVTDEYRNPATVVSMLAEVITPAAKALPAARRCKSNPRSMYAWNCKLCDFKSLCQAELRDYDAAYIRQAEYMPKAVPGEDTDNTDEKSLDSST